jgi:hypothetical protein
MSILAKLAAKKDIKSYLRTRDGVVEVVKPHKREVDEAEPEADGLGEPPPPPEVSESRAAADIRMWLVWKANGYRHEDLRPLLKSLEGCIGSQTHYFKNSGVRIPPSVIDAKAYSFALQALKTYDPTRNVQINTHVTHWMRKLRRVINTHRNMARIPENRVDLVRKFQMAQEALEDSLGRSPTDVEMTGYLKWPLKTVVTLGTELRRDLWAHSDKWEEDPTANIPSQSATVLKLIKYELTPDEKEVYRRFVEEGVDSTTEIAKLTGYDMTKVSRLKTQIATKISKYLEGVDTSGMKN